ncbi:MAG: hypothetical protein R3B84_13370 [Zavarzinella sp.]
MPSIVPSESQTEACSRVADILSGFTTADAKSTPRGKTWHFLHTVAQHYVQTLEVNSHISDATIIASLAWWSAAQVTAEIFSYNARDLGNNSEIISLLQLSIPAQLAHRSAISSLLGRPQRAPSSLAFVTTHFTALWRISLLEAGPASEITLLRNHQDTVDVLVAHCLRAGFPVRDGIAEPPILAIDAAFDPIAIRWLFASREQNHSEDLTHFEPEADEDATTPLLEKLRIIGELSPDGRDFLLCQFRTAVGLGMIVVQDMIWIQENPTWLGYIFTNFANDELEQFCLTILELIRQGSEEFQISIQRFLLQQVNREDLQTDRRVVAMRAIIQSSIISGHLGTLDLLVNSVVVPEILYSLIDLKRRLDEIRRVLPPLVQGRLRSVLVRLPSDDNSSPHGEAPDSVPIDSE